MNSVRCLLFLLFGCLCFNSSMSQSKTGDLQPSKEEYSILFIGNSLTYTNNLPALVEKRADIMDIRIKFDMMAYPDYAIMDHWNDGEIQRRIAEKNYDYVVVQQGPSSQEHGRELLFDYGNKLNELCKSNNAQMVYFMVWPSLAHYHTFDDVIKNYRRASELHGALLCPVGEKWKEHFDATGNFDYYGSDGFHPSLKGSNVAAEVLVSTLFGR